LSPTEEYEDGFDFGPRPKKRVRSARKEVRRKRDEVLFVGGAKGNHTRIPAVAPHSSFLGC
jgi:hypothetical protein